MSGIKSTFLLQSCRDRRYGPALLSSVKRKLYQRLQHNLFKSIISIMTLWKISTKSNWNWGPNKQLMMGMYIELSTPIGTPPLGIPSYHEVIAKAFNTKYSTNFDKSKMNASFLTCEKIG